MLKKIGKSLLYAIVVTAVIAVMGMVFASFLKTSPDTAIIFVIPMLLVI
jgi:hypothetical protein